MSRQPRLELRGVPMHVVRSNGVRLTYQSAVFGLRGR